MKSPRRAMLALLLLVTAIWGADEDLALKKGAKAKAEEINTALFNEEYSKVAALTHPKVVELAGGIEKMVAGMKAGIKDMKAKGIDFKSVKMDDAQDPVAVGSEIYIVVPFEIELAVPGGRLLQKSYVIGVTSDSGKSWAFINGDMDLQKIKIVLPNLPEKLRLPASAKPIFKKD